MNASYILPVIPKPKQGTAAILQCSGEGRIRGGTEGKGNIDLLCGCCNQAIAVGMAEGQMSNLVLQCPKCEAYNAVVSLPSIKKFISQLQAAEIPKAAIPKFKKVIKEAINSGQGQKEITEQIEQNVPEFSWFKQYLVPGSAGELYGFLAFVLAFITWYQSNFSARNKEPQTVINNYYMNNAPYKGVGRNEICPCGSGKKFKKCHGP